MRLVASMGKVLLGSLLLVAGLFASFIPPFIWGLPLFAAGLAMGAAGLFGTTVSAAKTVVAVSKEVSRASAAKPIEAQTGLVDSRRVSSTPAISATLTKSYDIAKWRALVDLDDDVAAAAAQARLLGPEYEDLLAEKYLPLNDKNYLAAALKKVAEKASADVAFRSTNPTLIVETGTYNGIEYQKLGSGQYK